MHSDGKRVKRRGGRVEETGGGEIGGEGGTGGGQKRKKRRKTRSDRYAIAIPEARAKRREEERGEET